MRDIRSVLISGGTGSFGRAFAAFLLANDMAERICIFSRGEHAQAAMRVQLKDDPRCRWFIGDVRDEDRLARAMEGVDLVVHAAALKRIEVGAYCPEEMVKTNVVGALNLVAAARRAHVDKVVALSSDKAFQPCSAYGASKAMMEQIVIAANDGSGANGPKFVATRYGNVWGSAGSILPNWLAMIRAGSKVVPTTDPGCTRFFMTIGEAVELVIGAAAHGQPGHIAIPTLPAYRVGDLAEALGVEMRITGLNPWEKKAESMTHGNCSDSARRMTVAELREQVDLYIRQGG